MSTTEILIKIKVRGAETDKKKIKSELRQDDSISLILFKLILEKNCKRNGHTTTRRF